MLKLGFYCLFLTLFFQLLNCLLTTKESDGFIISMPEKYVSGHNTDQISAVQFLHQHDQLASEACRASVLSEWNFATNITQTNKDKLLHQALVYAAFQKESWINATSFAWKSFHDPLVVRWFKKLSILGKAALPYNKLKELNEILADMENNYSTAKVCPHDPHGVEYVLDEAIDKAQCDLALDPDLTRIFAKSRDYDQLLHLWKSWRDVTGAPNRDKYIRFVQLSNEAAKHNGFNDTGDLWRESYESSTFESDLNKLWEDLRPLYLHLHAYVRLKLRQVYGKEKIEEDGPIPAHILGNMWAQTWKNLQDILLPFPEKSSLDVTQKMLQLNMTAKKIFEIAEDFFTSLGLKPMPKQFWDHSIIEKPKDREIVCHASAWDFCAGNDFRIKQCTDITMRDLIVTHHEMGHIQYFLQYAHQPYVFREGANPGFHEALGDALALSVSTPSHLHKIGLLDTVTIDHQAELNYLMSMALDKIVFVPFGYLMDVWRWKVFSGEISPAEMNRKWWELRLNYQGICPAVKRTERDFDPTAKYHISSNTPYIRYFISVILQFQFHKSLCSVTGHTGPLHRCDVYQSTEAGQLLSQVLELGSSEPWQETLKIMTSGETDQLDVKPILEYFDPLLHWLKDRLSSDYIGWKSDDPMICPGIDDI